MAVASISDVTVLCLGLDWHLEGECDDKSDIMLPAVQRKLADAVCEVCENVVVIIMAGSSVDIGEKLRSKAKAIIYGWYPGAQGGLALAKLLAGEKSPSGRLPITVYHGDRPLPDFTDYSMKNRTYRYIESAPLWPFGFGLSYSQIEYKSAEILSESENEIKLSVRLENKGNYDIDEKIQVYAQFKDSECTTPNYQLCAVKPLAVKAGESAETEININRFWIKAVTEDGVRKDPDGEIILHIGSSQPDELSRELGAAETLSIKIQ